MSSNRDPVVAVIGGLAGGGLGRCPWCPSNHAAKNTIPTLSAQQLPWTCFTAVLDGDHDALRCQTLNDNAAHPQIHLKRWKFIQQSLPTTHLGESLLWNLSNYEWQLIARKIAKIHTLFSIYQHYHQYTIDLQYYWSISKMCTAIVLDPTVFAKALHPDSFYPDVTTPSRRIDCGGVSGHAGEVRGLTARESGTCEKTRSLQHVGKRKQRTRIETCGPLVPLQIKHGEKKKYYDLILRLSFQP